MYKSPIEIMLEQMRCQMGDDIYTAVLNYGIIVDKEELLRALKYDRFQYDNGYRNGMRDANAELVRCRDCVFRQRETSGELYVICERNDFTEFPMDGYCCYGKRREENG